MSLISISPLCFYTAGSYGNDQLLNNHHTHTHTLTDSHTVIRARLQLTQTAIEAAWKGVSAYYEVHKQGDGESEDREEVRVG